MANNTCGNCPRVKTSDMCGLAVAHCDNGDIVPHDARLEHGKRGDATVVVFTRVPEWCPRPDTVKSAKPAPRKDWVTVKVRA